jgi:hypothetical protein
MRLGFRLRTCVEKGSCQDQGGFRVQWSYHKSKYHQSADRDHLNPTTPRTQDSGQPIQKVSMHQVINMRWRFIGAHATALAPRRNWAEKGRRWTLGIVRFDGSQRGEMSETGGRMAAAQRRNEAKWGESAANYA